MQSLYKSQEFAHAQNSGLSYAKTSFRATEPYVFLVSCERMQTEAFI